MRPRNRENGNHNMSKTKSKAKYYARRNYQWEGNPTPTISIHAPDGTVMLSVPFVHGSLVEAELSSGIDMVVNALNAYMGKP